MLISYFPKKTYESAYEILELIALSSQEDSGEPVYVHSLAKAIAARTKKGQR